MTVKKKMSPEEGNKIPDQEGTVETAPFEAPESPETSDNAESREALKKTEDNLMEVAVEWKERCQRITAEYQNYRNRAQKEKEALGGDVRADTVTQFLPVLDNLERALENEKDDAIRRGVELIHRQLLDVLEKLKVTEIEAIGQVFNPELMEAVMHVADETLSANTVTQVFTKGYRMGDRILRHTIVQVAN